MSGVFCNTSREVEEVISSYIQGTVEEGCDSFQQVESGT